MKKINTCEDILNFANNVGRLLPIGSSVTFTLPADIIKEFKDTHIDPVHFSLPDQLKNQYADLTFNYKGVVYHLIAEVLYNLDQLEEEFYGPKGTRERDAYDAEVAQEIAAHVEKNPEYNGDNVAQL